MRARFWKRRRSRSNWRSWHRFGKNTTNSVCGSVRSNGRLRRPWPRVWLWPLGVPIRNGRRNFLKLRGSSQKFSGKRWQPNQDSPPISPTDSQIADAANGADPLANFVPVPGADNTLDSDDPGMVVHVALTRASLGELGYPVDKAHATEIVQADVLVGEDGWPRAVRLLQ